MISLSEQKAREVKEPYVQRPSPLPPSKIPYESPLCSLDRPNDDLKSYLCIYATKEGLQREDSPKDWPTHYLLEMTEKNAVAISRIRENFANAGGYDSSFGLNAAEYAFTNGVWTTWSKMIDRASGFHGGGIRVRESFVSELNNGIRVRDEVMRVQSVNDELVCEMHAKVAEGRDVPEEDEELFGPGEKYMTHDFTPLQTSSFAHLYQSYDDNPGWAENGES